MKKACFWDAFEPPAMVKVLVALAVLAYRPVWSSKGLVDIFGSSESSYAYDACDVKYLAGGSYDIIKFRSESAETHCNTHRQQHICLCPSACVQPRPHTGSVDVRHVEWCCNSDTESSFKQVLLRAEKKFRLLYKDAAAADRVIMLKAKYNALRERLSEKEYDPRGAKEIDLAFTDFTRLAWKAQTDVQRIFTSISFQECQVEVLHYYHNFMCTLCTPELKKDYIKDGELNVLETSACQPVYDKCDKAINNIHFRMRRVAEEFAYFRRASERFVAEYTRVIQRKAGVTTTAAPETANTTTTTTTSSTEVPPAMVEKDEVVQAAQDLTNAVDQAHLSLLQLTGSSTHRTHTHTHSHRAAGDDGRSAEGPPPSDDDNGESSNATDTVPGGVFDDDPAENEKLLFDLIPEEKVFPDSRSFCDAFLSNLHVEDFAARMLYDKRNITYQMQDATQENSQDWKEFAHILSAEAHETIDNPLQEVIHTQREKEEEETLSFVQMTSQVTAHGSGSGSGKHHSHKHHHRHHHDHGKHHRRKPPQAFVEHTIAKTRQLPQLDESFPVLFDLARVCDAAHMSHYQQLYFQLQFLPNVPPTDPNNPRRRFAVHTPKIDESGTECTIERKGLRPGEPMYCFFPMDSSKHGTLEEIAKLDASQKDLKTCAKHSPTNEDPEEYNWCWTDPPIPESQWLNGVTRRWGKCESTDVCLNPDTPVWTSKDGSSKCPHPNDGRRRPPATYGGYPSGPAAGLLEGERVLMDEPRIDYEPLGAGDIRATFKKSRVALKEADHQYQDSDYKRDLDELADIKARSHGHRRATFLPLWLALVLVCMVALTRQ
ncbi:unnamed protein product [Vitrella brassicaformis CCMP3155]|uniref:Uncharacterized protein n=2 Tax=Vitrella brassicaformis TaxID=1169539 RepID=A0A0G4EVR3_VITBC|nr:unnamed protein product [Vitrella brassicaformis CCMP3155]|eukprot:CEM02186.1 unnamed protein product [Vitrella brassicaformis CCMP3155]